MQTTSDANAQLVSTFRSLAGNGQFLPVDQLFPADLSALFPDDYAQREEGMEAGVPGIRSFLDTLKAGFPDIQGRVDDVVAQGDRLVVRMTWQGTHTGPFMGVAPTGQQVHYGRIEIWRMREGKLAEHWGEYDLYGLLRQLGAVPALPS
ncbi:hypothetical protein DAETH_36460 (plasmid) [Deinococcus aetherius]|uniref:Ester cyclase n=2 Tax=Deinococcus aetherius TaxID=200252 RepID=A0ABM8AIM5_9DEIO|nr:hypothetical protein DAETH_36460 [Deinococcus aetherius]